MTRILSGIQPTGGVHLGNYLGAVRYWVEDQRIGESFYCVVDLHALTIPRDPAELRQETRAMATLLLAAGLDPEACTLFVQSHVPQHTQLSWLLECTASMGELRRMTQFKDKAAKGGEEAARVGLFTYPTLMAADILLYRATHVPVGEDQRQHLELTRDLAERFNTRYGPVFTVPEATIPPPGRGARIMDLQEPTRKMSKSAESDQGMIGLFDEPKVVERKIKRAVTDTDDGPDAVRFDPDTKPGVANLLQILAAATGGDPAEVATGYRRYGELKAATAEAVIELLRPVQARYRELEADPATVDKILRAGAERAEPVAAATLARAMDAIGLLPAR
ncbi:tryptophan--tRNA ligase [Acidimicrobiaceae bacterium USS-CC1]|uniref:Tryptophan--tRNA ligase n=1 Tax=Acidiferrimicrobium australe TaxID=2664430 RepID=A0ABW9QZQ9_9ACTN|nr:tryptophan--tRNA ligase [Acidiferrimicrobium australe]